MNLLFRETWEYSQFSPMFVSYYSKLGFKLFSTRNVTRNICEDRKKKKAFNNRLYKNIKTFRKQPFGNFSAFHSSTIPHFTSTIGRGLKLRRNSTSMRAHVLFSVYYVYVMIAVRQLLMLWLILQGVFYGENEKIRWIYGLIL